MKRTYISTSVVISVIRTSIREVVTQIEDLQDSGRPVPTSLINRWVRLYKKLERLENR